MSVISDGDLVEQQAYYMTAEMPTKNGQTDSVPGYLGPAVTEEDDYSNKEDGPPSEPLAKSVGSEPRGLPLVRKEQDNDFDGNFEQPVFEDQEDVHAPVDFFEHSWGSEREATCHKCKALSEACFCEDICCRSCARLLRDCECLSPWIQRRICIHCETQESDMTLFDERFPVLPESTSDFLCSECGKTDFRRGEYFSVQSAKSCQKCLGLGYRDMEWCEGIACEAEGLFHTRCMTLHNNAWYCDRCIPREDENVDQVLPHSSPEPTDEEDEDAGERPTMNQEGNDAKSKFDSVDTEEVARWNDAELGVWVKVTMRLAGALHRQDARLALLDARWTAAQPHVDASKLQDVETLIAEIWDGIQKWPEPSSEYAASTQDFVS